VRGQKLEKLLSNHQAQNKGGCIYAPIVMTSGEVGSKEGHGGGQAMVTSKPMVV
jgi:hypothetical protein